MTDRHNVAKAIAYFERCDDVILLHRLSGEVAPRAKRMVGRLLASGGEDAIPPPADLRAARGVATEAEAIAVLRSVDDFALLQVLAQAIGQRTETLEIAASAQFPEGARVLVPKAPGFPPTAANQPGTVEATGTMIRVRLDDGETWEGPPSLARLAPR